MEKKDQFNLWYVIFAVFAVLVFQSIWQASSTVERIPYSVFEEHLEDGQVARVWVGSEEIHGEYKVPRDGRTGFITARVEPEIAERLAARGVEYAGVVENTWLTTLLSWVVPVLIFVAAWLFIFRKIAERQGFGGAMSIGQSRAKICEAGGARRGSLGRVSACSAATASAPRSPGAHAP